MAVATLRVSGADLVRCRFATSPLWETAGAARAFVDPSVRPYVLPWWESVRDRPPSAELLAVQNLGPYSPDFVCAPPDRPAPDIDEQLARVRATPPEHVHAELARCRDDQPDPHARRLIDRMLAEPELADMVHRVVVTAEPGYLARFTSTNQVVSYQRRFLRAAEHTRAARADARRADSGQP